MKDLRSSEIGTSKNSMQVVALDFGTSKVGVAVGNTKTKTSSPISTLKYNSYKHLWSLLGPILTEWEPALIVVGMPLHMDGEESTLSDLVKAFAKQLETQFDRKVVLVDERLTSREARSMTTNLDEIDQLAAKIILDTWINQSEYS